MQHLASCTIENTYISIAPSRAVRALSCKTGITSTKSLDLIPKYVDLCAKSPHSKTSSANTPELRTWKSGFRILSDRFELHLEDLGPKRIELTI